ncbi:MAG: WD40/YVTN/BNR-like repeat-containing protein, partial [Woeseiaceae bacterium]
GWSFAKTSAGWLISQAYWQICSNCFEQTIVYVSNDGGANWTPIPDAESDLNSGTEGRTTLSVAVPGDDDVYALSANFPGSAQFDVFRSTDGGLNWTPLGANSGSAPTNPNFFNPTMDIIAGQAWYNHLLQVDPTDPSRDTVWLGGQLGNAVTRDGGATWTLVSGWLGKVATGLFGAPGFGINLPYVHADSHTAAISMVSGKKRLFFGHDGGVSYSDDDGKSWKDEANQGVVTSLIYALVSGTKHPQQTLIGLQDNGTRFRVGNSTRWTGSIGGDGFGVGWSQANNKVSMGSVFFLDIRRWAKNPPNNQAKYDRLLSTSNLAGPGGTWLNDSYFVTPIATPTATADSSGLTFYTNTRNFVLKTEDGGDSWDAIWESSGGRVVRSVSHGVGLSSNDLDVIGLAGSGGHFVYTNDGGASWTDVDVAGTLGTWPGFNSSVAWAPDNTTVYLASQSPLPSSIFTGPYVAKSTDGGTTWADATGNLPKVPVQKLYADPHDRDTVYAATWIGVFVTHDGGATWSPLGDGLPLVLVTDMYFPPDMDFVRISTYGRGVWELALD